MLNLPLSHEYPIAPFIVYSPHEPPLVPDVQVHPFSQPVLGYISSQVANEASNKARFNPARMFCYNLLVNNYYNNEFFREVVKLVADTLYMNYTRNMIRAAEAGVAETTAQILTLYTGDLLFKFPDLKSVVSQQVLEAAMQNVSVFNNLKMEIATMYGHGGFPQTPVQSGFPNNQYPNNMQVSQSPQIMMTPQGPMMMTPNGWIPCQVQQTPNQFPVVNNGQWGQAPMPNNQPVSRFGGVSMDRVDAAIQANPVSQSRYFSKDTPVVQSSPIVNSNAVYTDDVNSHRYNKVKLSDIGFKSHGDNVDRNKHQIVLFGNAYTADATERNKQLYRSTLSLTSQKVENEDNVFLSPKWFTEVSLDGAIISGKLKQHEKQKNTSDSNVFRSFAIVMKPIICTYDVSEYLDSLRDVEDFASLASKMKSIASALNIKRESNAEYTDSVMSFLNEIDLMLTKLVNEFLAYRLQVQITIGGFVDDIVDLFNLLHKKDSQFSLALHQYEKELMPILFDVVEKEVQDETLDGFNIPENTHVAIVPMNYSLTYTFMTAKEMKLNKSYVPLKQLPDSQELIDMMKSLEGHKKQMNMATMYDILITSDNVRFAAYKSIRDEDDYYLIRLDYMLQTVAA